jgi:hypothetical protein
MMWEAATPQGIIYWLDDMDNPLIGSPIVALRLREAAEIGIQAFPTALTIRIDLQNPGEVRFALETLYGPDAKFSETAPEATQFFEPVESGFVY